MKRFVSVLCVLLSLVLVLPLSGCSNEPKEITLLTWKDYVPEQILKDFTESSGIKVTVVTAETNEDMLGMIEKDPSAYDLAIVADYAADKLVQKNCLPKSTPKTWKTINMSATAIKASIMTRTINTPCPTARRAFFWHMTKQRFRLKSRLLRSF